ncbi:keratin, type I cytoskeletal 50 kDa [Fundulus heteroclitus]|uniref:keratin, type I cytoskeletal 50 kDa n=1 Tax=Fundulus heteroclitus TaxID=8078 RepID=UPI00165C1F37|nr:keratin, type I cytoskeletal 50 kDa [Fundulus heteroclitus]
MSFSSRSYSQRSVGQNTMSVYGGAGGHGTRISTPQIGYSSNAGGYNISDYHDLKVDANEKFALQNLNDRLASYLEKVHELEKENDRLEKQIKEWYTNKTVITHDYTAYFATIADLQDKIRAASTHNAKIYLEMDNSKLAAEDFKTKYENELSMRQAIEVDCAGLRKVLDELSLCRMDLESQYESLKDELVMMKKSHEEELSLVRTQVGGQVKVEVDAPPPTDLQTVMTEIRDHYEGDIAKNRKELELWFLKQSTVVEKDVEVNSAGLEASRLEIKELKDNLQKLQIEYQSCCSMISSLEATLHETQGQYAAQLAGLQDTVTGLEAHMSNLNATIKENKLKYDSLLDLKTRLEAEIAEYRRLLEGEDDSHSSKQVITKTIVVEETIVNGKVVTSTKSVDVDVDQIE